MWKNRVTEQTEKLFQKLPDNRFIQVDGQIQMMITPQELIEFSFNLLDAYVRVDLVAEGKEHATHDQ